MKRNAEFQNRAGVSPKIVRKSPTKCCPWCDALVGEYKYPDDVPDDVYRRHDNCNCIVEFYPGDGKKQNVWSKQWSETPKEVLEERKNIEPPVVHVSKDRNVNSAKAWGVEENPVEELEKPLSTDEIIDRVGGGDMTKGSCSSVAFTYAGNRCGYDVLDFRGGSSESYFCTVKNILTIAEDADGVIVEGYNDFKTAKELLDQVEKGKEYYFTAGQHAAIVRRTDAGIEWLELQSRYKSMAEIEAAGFSAYTKVRPNGFHPMTQDVLKNRFKCKKSHTLYGQKISRKEVLIDIDKLKEYDGFKELLGYINTAADKQKKGAFGTIK